jgi:hypothetical protein
MRIQISSIGGLCKILATVDRIQNKTRFDLKVLLQKSGYRISSEHAGG